MRTHLRSMALVALVPAACGLSVEWDEPGLDGSGSIATEPRRVAAFSRVDIADDFDVEITVGPPTAVSVIGDDNLLPHVRTSVVGETLEIESARDLSPSEQDIRVIVSTPRLHEVSSSGSSDVRIAGVISDRFSAKVAGSGEMVVDGAFGDLTAAVSGSGDLAMRGSAHHIVGRISGSGGLDLQGVEARTALLRVSGSGEASVNASESVAAEVSGSGHVRYAGTPRVSEKISGSGGVERI